jgi:hypothetical protein
MDLGDFIVSVLKHEQRRTWSLAIFREMEGAIRARSTFRDLPPAEALGAGQRATVVWAAQMRNYLDTLDGFPGRCATLHAEQLFEHPAETLQAVFDYYSVPVPEGAVSEVVEGDLFRRHAKTPGRAYGNDERRREQRDLASLHRLELEEALEWAKPIREALSIPRFLPCPVTEVGLPSPDED